MKLAWPHPAPATGTFGPLWPARAALDDARMIRSRPATGHEVARDVDQLGYRPDLDGLRAVAVLLVLITHAHFPWTNNGGDTGVTAFFLLSGYLITRLLVEEQAR